jgi:predicted RNA binding protein YcfA (HicA-like mRNA interferase family)
VKRTRGSHFFLTLPGHPKKSTVVKNTSKDVPQGALLSIKKQLKISREEFISLISLLL